MTKKMQEQQQEQEQKEQTPRTQSLYQEKKWRKPAGWMHGRWLPVANGVRR